MTAKFAGSGSLDDRRRRRLAQESQDLPAQPSRTSKRGKKAQEESSDQQDYAVSTKTDVVANESLIPASIWKVLATSFISFALWGLLIWFNLRGPLPAAFAPILHPNTGTGFRFLSVLSLMVTSQLSLIIFWYRSRSRKDFNGRYRIWGWAGAFWSVICLTTALQLHVPVSQLLYQKLPIHCWRPETIYWFVPYAIGALALHQLLAQDMRLSRLSRRLWGSVLVASVFVATLTLGLDRFFASASRDLVYSSSITGWQLLLMTTMLAHARFVVHVTNEAAPKRQSSMTRCRQIFAFRTRGLRAKLANWSAVRAERKATRKAQRMAAKAEQKASAQMRREERTQARADRQAEAKAKREQLAAENQAKREQLAAEKKAKLEADKQKRAADVAAKQAAREQAKLKTQQAKSVQTSEKSAAARPQAVSSAPLSDKGNRRRALGSNGRLDAPQQVQGSHLSSSRSSDFDEEDDEGRSLSRKERKKLRKKQRQR